MLNANNSRRANRQTQGGIMLLEALIAILIFSLGILALVGMQAATTKASGDAQYRTQASLLANELIGRMWAGDNTSPTVLKNNFESPSGTEYTNWFDGSVSAAGLPGVAAAVSVDTTGTTPIATITMSWLPPGESSAHRYVAIAQIKKN